MAVVKVIKTENYTVMSNYHLRDNRLNLKTKGLMSLILSLPQDWDYSIRGLEKYINNDGVTTIRTALKQLEEFGYLKRKRVYINGKIIDWDYTFYEEPKDSK